MSPKINPDQWTSTVVLSDGGTAMIRPITPDDIDALAAFHERQSPESKYRRFFSAKPTLSSKELAHFTNVDFVDRAAFVIEEHGEFIGWASYERWQNRDDAEVAFQVDDNKHGKGIATLLLEHLAALARHNELGRFTAQTLGENRGMLAVFSRAGWPVQRRFESGVIDVDFPLDTTAEFIDSVERREQRADSRAVARLLQPSSIAVIGASPTAGSVGDALWQNATKAACPVFAVNPKHQTIGTHTCYASVTDIDEEVGLAIVAVPSSELETTIDECITKRVRGAIVVTVADPSQVAVSELVERARRNGLRIIGPASMGVASPRPEVALQAALATIDLPPGRVAISMQSGTMGTALLKHANDLDLGVSWFVSLGSRRDISANDLLQFWEDDEATGVIAMYTETFGNSRKFARIARRVSLKKPIVAVRTGAALLADATPALFRQTGVIEVPTVQSLLDTVRVFAQQPAMDSRRVAVISNSRSPAVLATATLTAAGMEPAQLPIMLNWHSSPEDFGRAVQAAHQHPSVGAVLVIHAPPIQGAIAAPAAAIHEAATGANKPVISVMLGADDGPILPGSHVPNFSFPEQAAGVLSRLAAWSEWRDEVADLDLPEPSRIDPPHAQALIDEHLASGTMPPEALRDLLSSYGVNMMPAKKVAASHAVATATEMGFPVAVKAEHRHVGRTVEAGIALDLDDPHEVEVAVTNMGAHLGADAEQVIVQKMAPPGVDLRVRCHVDSTVGPLITAGIGGTHADAIADVESRISPLTPAVARSMLGATRAAALLDDDDTDRATELICRVAQLSADHPEIVHLDLNPVSVSDDGIWVLDASIELASTDTPEPPVRRLD